MRNRKYVLYSFMMFAAVWLSPIAHGANVNFQGRSYAISIVTLADNVPLSGASDLILITAQTGEKYLTLPTNGALRGDYDSSDGVNRYYVLNRFDGSVSSFATIDAALIKLDGTLFSTTIQNPVAGDLPLETFSKPITIPNTEIPVDVAIIDDNLIAYRTDGNVTGLQKVYANTRNASSAVQEQISVAIRNGDPGNSNQAVFVEYDQDTGNYLLVQIALDPNLNIDTRDRITAYSRDGTLVSDLNLENTTNFPTYSGSVAGMTVDPATGVIYLLDSTARQIIVITPRKPAITNVLPSSGESAGGTPVTITGVNLPSDAQVFFGGVLATNIKVSANGGSITATTPAHAIGVVDVTVTGTGIPITTPLKLTAAFSYVNTLPTATMMASPTQGLPPLEVSFTTSATDADGTIVTRFIDFGDGNTFTFQTDLSIVTTTHIYTAEGTYTARLTVTDNQGGQKKADQVIIVGEGADLILRGLSFKADGSADPLSASKDAMKLKGEIIVPDGIDFALGKLSVGFVNPNGGSLVACADNIGLIAAVKGGQYCGQIGTKLKINGSQLKFGLKPLTKRGTAPNTFSITFQGSRSRIIEALNEAVVNLKFHENGTQVTEVDQSELRQGKVQIVVRLETEFGESLQYRKLAVVQIKGGKSTRIQLTRR
jgi:PKD repeat protein